MIALDTNILVRFFAGDDPVQSPIAKRLILEELTAQHRGYVSLPVLFELIWVFQRTYNLRTSEVMEAINGLLEAPTLAVEQSVVIAKALLCGHEEIADSIIHLIGQTNGCTKTVTFDKRFARLTGVELLA